MNDDSGEGKEVDVAKKNAPEEESEIKAHDENPEDSEHEDEQAQAHDEKPTEDDHGSDDGRLSDDVTDGTPSGDDPQDEIDEAIAEEAEAPAFYKYVVLSTLLGHHGCGDILTEQELGFENMIRLVNNGSIAHIHTDAAQVALLDRRVANEAVRRAQERG